MLSQTAEYALRAALYLAEDPDRTARVGELAASLKVPRNYLSKTLHQLARAGVLVSTRGKNGGFRLTRPPAEITVYDVVSRFERSTDQRQCLLGRATCSEVSPCAAHHRWKKVKEQTNAFFQGTRLSDLVPPPKGTDARGPGGGRRHRAA